MDGSDHDEERQPKQKRTAPVRAPQRRRLRYYEWYHFLYMMVVSLALLLITVSLRKFPYEHHLAGWMAAATEQAAGGGAAVFAATVETTPPSSTPLSYSIETHTWTPWARLVSGATTNNNINVRVSHSPNDNDGHNNHSTHNNSIHDDLCFDPTWKVSVSQDVVRRGKRYPIHIAHPDEDKQPKTQGLFFLKPTKVGGSTASGAWLRIAKGMAHRLQKNYTGGICDGTFVHTPTHKVEHRDPSRSWLWSMVRHPTRRAVSHFFHFCVTMNGEDATLEHFRNKSGTGNFGNYQFHRHMDSTIETLPQGQKRKNDTIIEDIVQQMLHRYNYVALTERFDESMVMLQLLLDVPLGDILYLNTKVNGGYDDTCRTIVSPNITSEWKTYFQSEEWQDRISLDLQLYRAVQRSFDATIDLVIGRDVFERQLRLFRHAQKIVHETCPSQTNFPCTPEGKNRPYWDTDCMFIDMGCGVECLDKVAANLSLSLSDFRLL